ncbi:multiple sugar transport system permease protein [Aliiruegeria haliotis]|uniref:Multiple sugar transport system permease protein n=1 Tax=Aliiruegeria haliotis TaxID=1280846 RepID=A0A2T0RY57_9RHOB|nr:carbohydrate ABC transporter permease [Aliiruegeria haliotis]PRY26090.1 multiple sugar transport system permease protein [Aliiruegeria haliotis]
MQAVHRQPLSLKLLSSGFLFFWCIVAAFPIVWITVMSFKSPVDAFDASALNVIFGPQTLADGKGISLLDILAYLGVAIWMGRSIKRTLPGMVMTFADKSGPVWLGWIIGASITGLVVLVVFFALLPTVLGFLNPLVGPLGRDIWGFTTEHYTTVWIDRAFYRNFQNSMIVTAGVVTVSLTVGTLAGYGLARSGSVLAFGILIIALVFRALPPSVLVAGYLPVFINSAELLRPFLGDAAPTLYGKPYAVIAVLVAMNQPFTIWMLRSFFQNIPAELDEAARVDGCNHFQAFRRVIMPVMWPGVITTGLFSFLLAYNDFLVTSLLLDAQNQTMVPAIAGMFNRETTTTDQVVAVAAAVSITAPLIILVMVFQRQIVSGLTAGAVKG